MVYLACRGTYTLFLKVAGELTLQVGALGRLVFKPGVYAYVGSAFGPGGLRARLGHHTTPGQTARWHIDYLSRKASLVEIWYTCDPTRREHLWADVLAQLPDAAIPFLKFGASDCRCKTHLFYYLVIPCMDDFYQRLLAHHPDHLPLQLLLPGAYMRIKTER